MRRGSNSYLLQIKLGWREKKQTEKFENSQESNGAIDLVPVKVSGQLRLSSELKERG